MSFQFTLTHQKGHARAGYFDTPHGRVHTPIFMPVATLASIKSLDSRDLHELDPKIILANTYHLYLRPGMDVIEHAGGVHPFMNWEKPILTDSGGFQVFSLGKFNSASRNDGKEKKDQSSKITQEGVKFISHRDGTSHFFSPEKAIEIQRQIGADVIMAFDECTPDKADERYARQALNRTHAWAKQCKDYWESHQRLSKYGKYQALFGIAQGALHKDLRRESAQMMVDLDFDGIAIGGETIGYNMAMSTEIMDWLRDILPENKPRYAMGLGRDPQNLVDSVLAGYDMSDCVAPSRLARNGTVYHGKLDFSGDKPVFASEFPLGRLQIGNQRWKFDNTPIQSDCDCFTCSQGYSKSYLRHIYKTDQLTYFKLASVHNVRFMVRITKELREWVMDDR